jgi:hypothetical protein
MSLVIDPAVAASLKKNERAPRGAVPPALRLSEGAALAHKISDLAGGTASYDLFSQIIGNTKTSSSFARKVSALRQYGIIEDRDSVVVLSDLGNRIVTPRDESDDLLALKESMLRVETLNKMYERHRGRILPEDQFLNNLLVQDFKIPRDFSKSWVDHFNDAVLTAKLTIMRSDGKTQLVEQPALPINGTSSSPDVAPSLPSTPAVAPTGQVSYHDALPISLGKGRIAMLKLPDPWDSRKDLKRLLKMIQLSLSEDDADAEEETT